MPLSALPTLNAALNAVSAALILVGWVLIRRRDVAGHRACMLGAVGASILFLAGYGLYHAVHGSTRFTGEGPVRTLYFAVLTSHTVLAALLVPLIPATLWSAFTSRFERHARLARWTVPMCFYVSVTGVTIYLMLHRA
ncbi:MAG TPA: DUF420 domain-containing protein [Thermodesulfobacteriota bacterium]